MLLIPTVGTLPFVFDKLTSSLPPAYQAFSHFTCGSTSSFPNTTGEPRPSNLVASRFPHLLHQRLKPSALHTCTYPIRPFLPFFLPLSNVPSTQLTSLPHSLSFNLLPPTHSIVLQLFDHCLLLASYHSVTCLRIEGHLRLIHLVLPRPNSSLACHHPTSAQCQPHQCPPEGTRLTPTPPRHVVAR